MQSLLEFKDAETFVLKNGAVAVFTRNPNSVFSINLLVRFGSAYERKKYAGIAHFIEHMFFSGTKKFSRREISNRIDSIGGYMNAFTSREYTGYLLKVDSNHTKLAINTLFDCFSNCQFYGEQLEIERKIIANEIRDSYDNPTRHTLIEFVKACLDYRFGKPIAGEEKTIMSFKRNDLIKFFRNSHYIANCIISFSGPENVSKYLKLFEDKIIDRKADPLRLKSCIAKQKEKFVHIEKDIEQMHVCIGFPTISSSNEDYVLLTVLESILGGGLSSRIIYKIREKAGLSYIAHAFVEAEPQHGFFCVYAATKPEKVRKLVSIVRNELKVISQGKITERELKKAKRHIIGSQLISWEDSLEVARDNAFAFVSGWSWKEYFERLKNLKLNELKNFAREQIDANSLCTVFLGPKNSSK